MATKRITTDHSVTIDNPRLGYLVVNPFTDEDWLYERTFGVGASKCGVLLGCRMYEGDSEYNLWRNILGLAEPINETWSMKKGHILEDYVASLFEKEYGMTIVKSVQSADVSSNWLAVDREKPFMRVSPDRIFWTSDKSRKMCDRGILEIKSSCKMYEPEDLTDPGKCLMWFCQVQYQLYVMRLQRGVLGFIHDDGPCGGEYWFKDINYNKEFCENTLIPAIESFWNTKVLPAKNILDSATRCDELDIERLNRFAPELTCAKDVPVRYPDSVDGKNVVVTPGLEEAIEQYRLRREQINRMKALNDEIADSVKLLLKDAESLSTKSGDYLATYKTDKSGKRVLKIR